MVSFSSQVREVGPVVFPPHTDEKIYMRPITLNQPLPDDISRWQNTVDMMGADFGETRAYLMVDQTHSIVGSSRRRGGWHIDGNWDDSIRRHGPGHRVSDLEPEALVLACDSLGCHGCVGEIEGEIGEGGDLSHIDMAKQVEHGNARWRWMQPNRAYSGNVTFIHASPIEMFEPRPTQIVRLNVPGVEI